MDPVQLSFRELLDGSSGAFPVLRRAVEGATPAEFTVVRWPVRGDGGWVWLENYTQIVRWPYDSRPVQQGSATDPSCPSSGGSRVDEFLACVEKILTFGVPSTGRPMSCGGVRHFLGRDLAEGDVVRLRPLREPCVWTSDWPRLGASHSEIIAEFSLEVIAAAEVPSAFVLLGGV